MNLSQCHVVLVRPKVAANIGAVSRAMRNMGVEQLVLVAPEADLEDPRGRLTATHSQDIIDNARIVTDLPSAIGDCVLAIGTSARTGGLYRKQTIGTPRDIMPHMLEAMAEGPVALVFGPETSGLTNLEVALCQYLIHIPTADIHPVLNLAQAATICLYEFRCLWLEQNPETRLPDALSKAKTQREDTASLASQALMFEKLQLALEQIHFLYGPKADSLMHALRHLISRARPSTTEVDILLGLTRQIDWYCTQAEEKAK